MSKMLQKVEKTFLLKKEAFRNANVELEKVEVVDNGSKDSVDLNPIFKRTIVKTTVNDLQYKDCLKLWHERWKSGDILYFDSKEDFIDYINDNNLSDYENIYYSKTFQSPIKDVTKQSALSYVANLEKKEKEKAEKKANEAKLKQLAKEIEKAQKEKLDA